MKFHGAVRIGLTSYEKRYHEGCRMDPVDTPMRVDELLELFNSPILGFSEVMWLDHGRGASNGILEAHGGPDPAYMLQFDGPNATQVLISERDDGYLRFIVSSASDGRDKALDRLVRPNSDSDDELSRPVGLFYLGDLLLPVPEWSKLDVTKAIVVSRNCCDILHDPILGFVIWVNLGVRLGLLTAPYPGLSVSFNDSCDTILAHAREAEREGIISLSVREYPGRESPGRLEDIKWFEWLTKP